MAEDPHREPRIEPAVPMINPTFVETMAAYNAEMNRRVYAAAGRLSDGARRLPRGAFWGTIHGTLCHVLWG
ncbi:MAG: hypothetical protein FWD12_03305, partial [Alphaproteobacteria bacterium]|nr:hypothetical protein [Alphaproteobacteria bacterium]